MYISKLTKTLFLASVLFAINNVNASAVDVTYEVTGGPGAWTLDFTFNNNLTSAASLYFVGVKADGFHSRAPAPFMWAFSNTYNTASAGGQNITYNNLWLDFSLNGLAQGRSLSGFKVPVYSQTLPSSFEWFAMTRGGVVTDAFDFGSATTAGFQGVTSLTPAIPEPESVVLMSLGLGALFVSKRKRIFTSQKLG